MKSRWPDEPIPNVCFFQEGPGLRKWQWTSSGMKVINVTNILGDGRVDVSNTDRFISIEEFSSRYRHFEVQDRDTVVASSGNTYGKVGRINSDNLPLMMNTSVVRFRSSDVNRLDDDYLYCFLRSSYFREQVEKFVIGAAQPNFGPSHIARMKMPLPPIDVQQAIASILCSYDHLIDNNTRRISVTEKMARLIFDEWFVRFRAPNCNASQTTKSSVGLIPKNWRVARGTELFVVNPEQMSPREAPEVIHYIDIASVSPGVIDTVTPLRFSQAPGRARRIVRHGDTIWSCVRPNRRSFALIIDPMEQTVASTGFAVLRPRELSFAFIYLAATTAEFTAYLTNHATGSAYPAVKAEDFEKAEFVVPPAEIVGRFGEIVEPMLLLINNLHQQNFNLRAQRDLLLPKLLSGEIDISRAEPIVEAA